MNYKKLIASMAAAVWIISVAGCGGSSSSGDDAPAPDPTFYSVGGSVFGLHGTVVLDVNGGHTLPMSADGTFAIGLVAATGSSYTVSVLTQPANQICTVQNGSGVLAGTGATNVVVNCSTITRVVGGVVYGLDPSGSVVLQNNAGDDLTLNSNGNFSFATPVAQSGAYSVTVLTQPATQTCSVSGGNGTVGGADISDVQVTCSTNAYTVGGNVSGLTGTVVLRNNGADDLFLSADGSFTFSTPVAEGAPYDVTVFSHPATQTCLVTNGSGTMAGANVTNVALTCTDNTTTLATSISDLALSVSGLTEYGVSGTPGSGLARTITITNTGSHTAFNLLVTQPLLPAGSTANSTCSATLPQGSSCTLTYTPGATATSDGTNPCSTGTAPIPGVVEVEADNASTVSSNVVVLSYGCVYQGGYVYAFDDTTPNNESVGGKVVATTDQAASYPNGIIWSSNGVSGSAADVVSDAIFGISQLSTTSTPNPAGGQVSGQSGCNGALDGACNTNNIHVYYQNHAAGAPINTSYYAAGLCKQTIAGYSDWSLPAICELGYSGACGSSGFPTLQNMQSNLVEFNGLNLLTGVYWSSSEASSAPQLEGWVQFFHAVPFQSSEVKSTEAGVRCSRALSF